jgi:hypothetical protein
MLGLSNMRKVGLLTLTLTRNPNPNPSRNPNPLHALTGDGIAFRDFLTEKFPNVRNGCVGRAEFSKRYFQNRLLPLTSASLPSSTNVVGIVVL